MTSKIQSYISLFCFLLLPAIGFSQANLSSGLIIYYDLDNRGNNQSPNRLPYTDAVVEGATGATGLAGTPATALYFDGIDDYLSLEPASMTEQIAVSLWFNTYAPQGGTLLGWENQAVNLSLLPGGQVQVNAHISNVNKYTFTSPGPFNDGKWHHILADFDGLTFRVFLDGVPTFSDEQHGSGKKIYYESPNLLIAASCLTKSPMFFAGRLDEIAIYNRSLSMDEITLLSNKVSPQNTVDLGLGKVVWVPFQQDKPSNLSKNRTMGTEVQTVDADLVVGLRSGNDRSLLFNGRSSHMILNRNLHLNQFSIGYWINTNSSQTAYLMGWDSAGYQLRLNPPGALGKLQAKLWLSPTEYYSVTSEQQLNDGRWHHIYLSYDGEHFRTAIDGRLIKESNELGKDRSVYYGSDLCYIGGSPSSEDGCFYQGQVDELAIFNRALSEKQLSTLIERPESENEDIPVRLYSTTPNTGGGIYVAVSNYSSTPRRVSLIKKLEKGPFWSTRIKPDEHQLELLPINLDATSIDVVFK